MTPQTLQIDRRLHHRVKEAKARSCAPTSIDVPIAELEALQRALWAAIERANKLEDRLANRPVTKRVPYLRLCRPEDMGNPGSQSDEVSSRGTAGISNR
jgi:hypothetical protein